MVEVFRAMNPSREVVAEEGAYVNATPRKDGKHVSSAPYQPAPTRSSSPPLLLYTHDFYNLLLNNSIVSAHSIQFIYPLVLLRYISLTLSLKYATH